MQTGWPQRPSPKFVKKLNPPRPLWEAVKRSDLFPPVIFDTPSAAQYDNYLATSSNMLHYVGTSFCAHENVTNGLLLGLNFVLFPSH
jgi:hypothetical protein